jgi:hypothetical protein
MKQLICIIYTNMHSQCIVGGSKFLYKGDVMKKVMIILSITAMVVVANLFAMDVERPTSTVRHPVNWKRRAESYLADLKRVGFIDDTMRARGNEIKEHIQNHIHLLRKINQQERFIDANNARERVAPERARRLDFDANVDMDIDMDVD